MVYAYFGVTSRVGALGCLPARENGSENTKTREKRARDDLLLEQSTEKFRRCNHCHVQKSFDSFSEAASTSRKSGYTCCVSCLDKVQSGRFASGETKYTLERDGLRSLSQQSRAKADLFGTEGYEKYAAACEEANPQKTPAVPKPRRQLKEMAEKTLDHGMFAIIPSCLFSDSFLEVCRLTH